jgi:hypothetical protein
MLRELGSGAGRERRQEFGKALFAVVSRRAFGSSPVI